jgi:thymidylate synthase (FAD)
MKIADPSVTLIRVDDEPAKLIEQIGRTCYKSEDKITEDSADKFVKMLADRGHYAMIEHAHASFRIVCNRGVSHELVRHRLASYAQESTRYCNYGKAKFGREITVVKPPGLSTEADREWRHACADAEARYFKLLDAGAKPQIARSVLPICLKTEICITTNFREFSESICHLRLAPAAHPEMRVIAYWMWEHLVKACPVLFERHLEAAELVARELL